MQPDRSATIAGHVTSITRITRSRRGWYKMRSDQIALALRWAAMAPRAMATVAIAATIITAWPGISSAQEEKKELTPAQIKANIEVRKTAIAKNMDPHDKIFQESSYPGAAVCGACHTQIYKEWASSNHAYASISPMFHKFEQTINDLSSGTVRDFCVRCHQQVGTQRGEKRWQPLWERSQVAREGITCITCHRITEEYAKTNGQRTVQPGDISRPVSGTGQNSVLRQVIAEKDEYRITLSPG